MSKSKIENKIISLNSADAFSKNNNSYNSDVLFKLPGLIKKERDITNIQFQIIDAQIPISFYNINYTNNVLTYQISSVNYSITVDVGNYNYNSLAINMISKFLLNGHIFTSTINKQTGVISFLSPTVNFTFIVSSIFSVLGLKINKTSTSFALVMDYPLNLLGITKVKLSSQLFNSYNVDSFYRGLSNVIAVIPIDQPSFGLLSYENKSTSKYKLRTDTIDEIDILILDQNNNSINFNNIDWGITILLEITRENNDVSKVDMMDILKEQDKIFADIAKSNQTTLDDTELPQVEQPISDVQTDDLQFFIYQNPNIII